MKAVDLKKWMDRNDVTAIDIAAALKMHPVTIERFIKGGSARRSTIAAFERYIASFSNQGQTGGQKPTGS